MAEFGPEATQLSAPQGAGANPTEGVQTSSYTPNLAPIANLASGISDIFSKLKKDKGAEQDQMNLTGFTNDLSAAEQEFEQTGDANRFAVRKGQLIRKWQVAAPHLSGEYKKILGVAQEGTTGRAEDVRKQRQEFEKDALMEGFKMGIPNVPGNEKTTIEAVLATRRFRAKQDEAFQTAERNAKMAGWSDEEKKRIAKEQSGQNLVELSGAHLMSFGANLNALAKRVSAGMDPAEAMGMAMSQYNSIIAQLDAIAVYDPCMAEPFRRQFNQTLDAFKPYFAKGADVEGIENEWKKIQAQSSLNVIGKNPKLLELNTLSRAFQGQPHVGLAISAGVSEYLSARGLMETGNQSPAVKSGVQIQIVGDTAKEKEALDTVKKFIKSNLDGKAGKDKDAVRKEVGVQLKGMMGQYADAYQLRKLTPESKKLMNEFLLDPDVQRFIKENPLPYDVARGLAAAADDTFKQFQRTFNERTGDLLKGVDVRTTVQKMGGRGMGGQNQKPSRTESVNPIDAVNISWRNGSLVFDPVNLPVDKVDQNRLLSELNSLSTVFTNGVKIGAAIQGEDANTFFENNKHRLFPEKFEAPKESGVPKTTEGQDYSKESNLKGIVNSAPMVANGTPADNVRQIREELKKQKDPAAIDALLQELEKELDKMR